MFENSNLVGAVFYRKLQAAHWFFGVCLGSAPGDHATLQRLDVVPAAEGCHRTCPLRRPARHTMEFCLEMFDSKCAQSENQYLPLNSFIKSSVVHSFS